MLVRLIDSSMLKFMMKHGHILYTSLLKKPALPPMRARPNHLTLHFRVESAFTTATKQRAQRSKRRGDNLGQHVHNRLPDQTAVVKLRVIERAQHRQAQINHAFAVAQELQRLIER